MKLLRLLKRWSKKIKNNFTFADMSSLAVSFQITQLPGCGSLEFLDTTEYGNGQGSGNLPSCNDIGSTTIEFDLNDGTTPTITTFIPTESQPEIDIFAGDLNYVDNIPYQIVTVTYTIYDKNGAVLGTASSAVLFC